MNALEKLDEQLKKCEACIYNSIIIDLNEVPEEKRSDFKLYSEKYDLILFCKKCSLYLWLKDDLS